MPFKVELSELVLSQGGGIIRCLSMTKASKFNLILILTGLISDQFVHLRMRLEVDSTVLMNLQFNLAMRISSFVTLLLIY